FVLACTAFTWMLQAWLPPRWALFGGVLSILMLATTLWPNTYWGGNVAALGGALLFGGLRRLANQARTLPAVAIAVGLAILANTRPYEGLVVSVPAAVVFLAVMIRDGRLASLASWTSVILPLALILSVTAGW